MPADSPWPLLPWQTVDSNIAPMTTSCRLLVVVLLLAICGFAHAAPPTIVLADGKAVSLSEDQLRSVPRQSLSATSHGKSARYEGYDLVQVLKAAGVSPVESLRGKDLRLAVRVTAADGYQVVFALSELDPTLGGRRVVLADRADGAPLAPADGPWRLVVPDDSRPARWVRQVTSIAVGP
ncbi:MAG TPA: molybdopterin-binding protein [Xanthomonadaceae bacterium]|nr:molybdopterin-binding protein [Xanthomonadaceae bacterium]